MLAKWCKTLCKEVQRMPSTNLVRNLFTGGWEDVQGMGFKNLGFKSSKTTIRQTAS